MRRFLLLAVLIVCSLLACTKYYTMEFLVYETPPADELDGWSIVVEHFLAYKDENRSTIRQREESEITDWDPNMYSLFIVSRHIRPSPGTLMSDLSIDTINIGWRGAQRDMRFVRADPPSFGRVRSDSIRKYPDLRLIDPPALTIPPEVDTIYMQFSVQLSEGKYGSYEGAIRPRDTIYVNHSRETVTRKVVTLYLVRHESSSLFLGLPWH